MLNVFRVTGDLLHVISIFVVLFKIRKHRSCAGLSLRSQELYALVFTTRYLDLFYALTVIPYNSVLKILFLSSSYMVIYLMRTQYRHTYDKEHDTFPSIYLIAPCFILALFINQGRGTFDILEILWAFSIYLEAVAILPQLFMLQRKGEAETLTSHYIFCLGGYRAMYILNWVYRYLTEDYYWQMIIWVSGTVQTIIYCDFFYNYVKCVWRGQSMKLPQ